MRKFLAATAVLAGTLATQSSPSVAAPETGRVRTIDCGADGILTVELGPAQFINTTAAFPYVPPMPAGMH